MDMDKLFEGIYAIQKQLGEFQQEVRQEMTEIKKDIKGINGRLDCIEASLEPLANRQFKHETEIEVMKKRFFASV
ncbi:MAG: hypothetical protein ACH0QD_07990 [Tepidibacillus sp.]